MENLSPAYFALVMATGIVSLAAEGLAHPLIAKALFAVNLAAYATLCALTLIRAVVFPRRMIADLSDHRIGPGFFTWVAGSCLIGAQFLLIGRNGVVAAAFLAVGVALWAMLTYAIFAALIVRRDKPPLANGLSNLWLVAVVATQSVAVLATLVARDCPEPSRAGLDFFALAMWLWGVTFYILIIALIFYRYTYEAFAPSDLDPASWITMGAMAISALAGASLTQQAAAAPFLVRLSPFLEGLTLMCWATGTWWIPLLLALWGWRLSVDKAPPRYDPSVWAAVFPLGMYCEATRQMAAAFDLGFLNVLSRPTFIVALITWAIAFAGLLWDLGKSLGAPKRLIPGLVPERLAGSLIEHEHSFMITT